MSSNGLISIQSRHSPDVTMGRLKEAVVAKKLNVFADIDHEAGATAVGLSLRPTRLLILGNTKGGTPLMQSAQTAGIDLPLKVLIWQDASEATWLTFNDPAWLAARHRMISATDPAVLAMSDLLKAIGTEATA